MLERIAKRRRLRAGEFVYTQGDAAQHFYIVEAGRVRVLSDAGRARADGHLSWSRRSLRHRSPTGGRRVTSAQALEPSMIWAIANQDLDELTERLPTLASRIIKALTLRLRDVMVLVESVATWPARLRVANFLLAHRGGRGPESATGWAHESIADVLGCARQTVTKTLNEFTRARWNRVECKHVFVINQGALERLVDTASATTARRALSSHEPSYRK